MSEYRRILRTSPIGALTLHSDGARITGLDFRADMAAEEHTCPVLEEAALQLAEYFSGTRRVFSLPLYAAGTPFQRRVWEALCGIPWGKVCTYGEIAARIGAPGASRAVGGACHRNPIPVIIPCHRVVAASGLGGFGGGLPVKRALLSHEGLTLDNHGDLD